MIFPYRGCYTPKWGIGMSTHLSTQMSTHYDFLCKIPETKSTKSEGLFFPDQPSQPPLNTRLNTLQPPFNRPIAVTLLSLLPTGREKPQKLRFVRIFSRLWPFTTTPIQGRNRAVSAYRASSMGIKKAAAKATTMRT